LEQIWFRHYQILEQKAENGREAHQEKAMTGRKESMQLVEIGPRFTLEPIRIFRGTFGGQTLYQNPQYVSPNVMRSVEKRKQGRSYELRKESQNKRKERSKQIIVPEDPLGDVFRS
jgi:ribosome biogenesis protein BRX1